VKRGVSQSGALTASEVKSAELSLVLEFGQAVGRRRARALPVRRRTCVVPVRRRTRALPVRRRARALPVRRRW
jgi:hypothetical protein